MRIGGNAADSLKWCDLAIGTLLPVHAKDRREVRAKEFLRNSHWARAMALEKLNRSVDAVK